MATEFTTPTEMISRACEQFATPFHLYDVASMRRNTERLYGAMSQAGVPGFMNYFAVKALPNPHVLQELAAMGHGFDCSSAAELSLAEMIGVSGERVMFTSNNTTDEEFKEAVRLGAIINFDDESYVTRFLANIGVPEIACCRYNPGDLAVGSEEVQRIIGKPSDAKFGMGRDAIIRSYKALKSAGVERFGLHTMLLSNNLSWRDHARIAGVMFRMAREIAEEVGITFEFINLGGGIGVGYHPNDEEFDYEEYARIIRSEYDNQQFETAGRPRIVMENGRSITATAGWLVTSVQNLKHSHKEYVGVDASMANLMRPAMYGAYHHITLLGDDGSRPQKTVDIVGALCENNDKFAIDRLLPELRIGDKLVIHTTGAHGHAMGFNYNGRLRSAELLYDEDGSIRCIRRAETLEDLFRTLAPLEDEV